MLCGGMTPDTKKAEAEQQEVANSVREALEVKAPKPFEMFNVVSYKSQVVAGTNFLMKIQIYSSNDGFVHAKIFRPLPHTNEPPQLHPDAEVHFGKTEEDPIET